MTYSKIDIQIMAVRQLRLGIYNLDRKDFFEGQLRKEMKKKEGREPTKHELKWYSYEISDRVHNIDTRLEKLLAKKKANK